MSSLYVKLSSGSPGHLNKTQILSWVPEALLSGLSSLSKLPVDHAVAPDPLLPEHPALTPSALRLLCPPPGTPCEQIRLLLRVLGEASLPVTFSRITPYLVLLSSCHFPTPFCSCTHFLVHGLHPPPPALCAPRREGPCRPPPSPWNCAWHAAGAQKISVW